MVKTDAIVEGVHFFPDDPPDTIARKALRVNLSDLASKGATPAGFVLTLALRAADDAWLTPFARGLGEDAGLFGCPLLGGDTVSTPGPRDDFDHGVRAGAAGQDGPSQRRETRRPRRGDRDDRRCRARSRYSEGRRGRRGTGADAAAKAMLVGRYRVPQPRNALAQGRFAIMLSAAMDVSDGLAGDLAKLCAASGVSAVIDAPSIPLSAAAAAVLAHGTVGIGTIVSGGDDYEILCAVPEDRFEAFARAAGLAGVAVTSIGTVIAGDAVPSFLDARGQGDSAAAPVLQPFLGFLPKSWLFRGNTCRNRPFRPSAALRPSI